MWRPASRRRALIFADESDTSDRVSYYTMALADGMVSPPIFERDDADVESILTDVNRIAWGVTYSGLTPSYEFFDESLTRRMAAVTEHFAGNSVGSIFIVTPISANIACITCALRGA